MFAVALLVLVAALPAAAQTFTMSITCTGSGQTCTPVYSTGVTLGAPGPLTITITAPPTHCSNVGYIVSVDSSVVTTTAYLTPGQSSGAIVTSSLSAGAHTISVQGIGTVGGCNSGSLASWGGSMAVTQAISGTPLPPSLTLTLVGMIALGIFGLGSRRLAPGLPS